MEVRIMKYIPLDQQIALERQKNARLRAENIKLKGDVDYIAMMTDIELDDDKESEESENA